MKLSTLVLLSTIRICCLIFLDLLNQGGHVQNIDIVVPLYGRRVQLYNIFRSFLSGTLVEVSVLQREKRLQILHIYVMVYVSSQNHTKTKISIFDLSKILSFSNANVLDDTMGNCS
jgi:hypothetical protein